MAELSSVTIQRFKGIRSTTISFENRSTLSRFVTLVGLNESGKTTILEGIAHSALGDPETATLIESVQGSAEMNDLIPKQDKAAFTDKVNVTAHVSIDSADLDSIAAFLLREHNFVMDRATFPAVLRISRDYIFEESVYKRTFTTWHFGPKAIKVRGYKPYTIHSDVPETKNVWFSLLKHVQSIVPKIFYFPTFLIAFPDRIYLEGDHGKTDSYYRSVIQDALKSLKRPLSLETHILSRVSKFRTDGKASAGFGSRLRRSPEGQSIDASVQQLAAELNRVIFGAWNEIFGKRFAGKRINVEWHFDEGEGNHVYLEVYIIEGDHRYYIGERSLGFRWFFSFLLFTQFNAFRGDARKTIFLFDEPASHLHARAQMKLLDSFARIAEPDHKIVYSTHSHYMINPMWLEAAYIVKNNSQDLERDDVDLEFDRPDPDIDVIPYKRFVAENPSKTTYFQPVLDTLHYKIDPLSLATIGRAVVLEGKYDYFPFMILSQMIGVSEDVRVYPATGAGNMAALISAFRAWGVDFVIVLDDDAAGRKERNRYIRKFAVSDKEVVTLGDLLPELSGCSFEGIFQKDVVPLFKKYKTIHSDPISKLDLYQLFQAIVHSEARAPALSDTTAVFSKLASALGIAPASN